MKQLEARNVWRQQGTKASINSVEGGDSAQTLTQEQQLMWRRRRTTWSTDPRTPRTRDHWSTPTTETCRGAAPPMTWRGHRETPPLHPDPSDGRVEECLQCWRRRGVRTDSSLGSTFRTIGCHVKQTSHAPLTYCILFCHGSCWCRHVYACADVRSVASTCNKFEVNWNEICVFKEFEMLPIISK